MVVLEPDSFAAFRHEQYTLRSVYCLCFGKGSGSETMPIVEFNESMEWVYTLVEERILLT